LFKICDSQARIAAETRAIADWMKNLETTTTIACELGFRIAVVAPGRGLWRAAWLMACATVVANVGPTLRSRGAFVRCQCADVIALKRGYNVDDNLPPGMALAGNVAHHIR